MLDTIRSNQWRIGKAAVLTLLISISSSTGQAQGIKFSEVARQLGVPGNVENGVSAYGHGVIIADLNNDLLPDIYISNAVRYADHLPETLYLSSPNGYVECDKARGVDDPYGWTGSHGICFVDYDNDGDYDIFNATTDDRNRLYQNDGNAFFKNVTDLAGLPLIRIVFPDFDSAPYGYGTRGVVAFDADNDGDMDLFAVNWGPAESRYDMTKIIKVPEQPNEFYLNNGNGTFKSVTNSGLTHPPNRSWMGTQGVAAGDIDNDGDIDVLIIHRNYTGIAEDGRKIEGFDSGRQVPNQLMINDGTGKFTDETAARGLFDPLNDANGATLADYDNDGDLDIFIPPKAKTRGKIRVYRNRGNGFFDDVTDQLNLTQWGFSTFLFDADNDGDLDLIAPRTRDTTLFYRNRGNGTFELLSNTGVELYNYDPRGGAVADIDNDGDLDLYLADANKELQTNAGNRLFRNELNSTNRWLKVTGRGPKGDLGGFGTKIWVFDRGHMEEMTRLVGYREVQNAYGYLCQDDPVQHFGLGQRDSADVKVRLLDGTVLKMYSVPANTRLYFSRPRQLVKTGGDGQTEVAFSPLPQPLKVQVRDAYGRTIYGARVIFTSDDPSGRFTTEQVYSDIAGNAQIGYVLGVNRTQTITAWCEADPSARVVFTASAIEVSSVASLVKSGGDAQQGQGGYPLPQKLSVRALNSAGIGIPGVAVIFEPAAGCGSIAGLPRAERLTSADGYAEAEWTLGNRPSTQQQCAVYVKDQPTLRQIFQAGSFGPPEKLVLLGSQRPAGRVDQPLNDSVVVQITDSVDRPLRNILVQFAVAAGGGLVNRQSSVQVATRANGCAEVQWKLGTQAGRASQVLQVTSPAIPNRVLTVTADALPGPAARLEYVSGDGQVGILTQPLPEPLAVRVSDTFGNAIE
ncbi:MAG: CRTAC1 family protein, partial [candidate division KSB1 bacterium]|nr:CRTAC1 family protein [candidate division KSB1 bacterium]